MPILLTNGIYEKSFQEDLGRLRSRYPGLPVVDLEGGHSVNIEAAEGFNEACESFLADIEAGDRGRYLLQPSP